MLSQYGTHRMATRQSRNCLQLWLRLSRLTIVRQLVGRPCLGALVLCLDECCFHLKSVESSMNFPFCYLFRPCFTRSMPLSCDVSDEGLCDGAIDCQSWYTPPQRHGRYPGILLFCFFRLAAWEYIRVPRSLLVTFIWIPTIQTLQQTQSPQPKNL